MRRPATVLRKLIDDLRAIEDPGERGARATEALEQVKALNAEVAQIRQTAARELKAQGLTYKEIGERFGPEGRPLHFSRIQQIIRGEATGRWAKVAREEAAKSEQRPSPERKPESAEAPHSRDADSSQPEA